MNCIGLLFLAIAFAVVAGCKTQRIEYHTRPAWHYSMTNSIQNEVVRDDGTIVRYAPIGGSASSAVRKYLDSIELEKVDEITGEVTLHAVLPEHLLTQTLVCLRDRNWDLLYDQILSESAKRYFGERDEGPFEAFFDGNRRELAKSIRRMIQGKAFGDVFATEKGNLLIHTFSPRMVGNFKFKKITFLRDGEYLKLHSIE